GDADVLPRSDRLRSRAAPTLDRAQCLYEWARIASFKVRRGGKRNRKYAKTAGAARCGRETEEVCWVHPLWENQDRIQFCEARVSGSRPKSEGIHPRRRYFSGCHQPAFLCKNAGPTV